MNFAKFLYDLLVYLTNNYSQMPEEFRKRFPEGKCVSARLYVSSVVNDDSELNEDFKDYE